MHSPITAAATPTTPRKTTTAPLPTITNRSAWIPNTQVRTTVATPIDPKAISTAHCPTTTRRSGSILRAVALNGRANVYQERFRPRDRRLQRGDPDRSQLRDCFQKPRPRLCQKDDFDRAIGDYRSGDRARSPICRRLRQPRRCLRQGQGRQRSRHRRLQRRDPLRSEYAIAYNDRGYTYAKKKDYDRAIADYNEAIKYRSVLQRGLQQPLHRLREQGSIRAGDRRISINSSACNRPMPIGGTTGAGTAASSTSCNRR